MPNVMAAQPNIGGALCESSVIPFLVPRRKVRLTPTSGVPCSNAANIGERKIYTEDSYTEASSVPSNRVQPTLDPCTEAFSYTVLLRWPREGEFG